jgi:anti-sigma factor RsiW
MSACDKTRNLFSLYSDGEASPHDRRDVESHLEGCPGCRREFAACSAVTKLLADLPRVEPTPGFEDRVLARVRASAVPQAPDPVIAIDLPREPRWWQGFIPRFAAAGAAFALVLFAVSRMVGGPAEGPAAEAPLAESVPVSPAGTEKPLSLEQIYPDLPSEVVRALDTDSYVLDRMEVQPGSPESNVRVVAPLQVSSGDPVYVTF